MFQFTKLKLLQIMLFAIFVFGLGLSSSCKNHAGPCDSEGSQLMVLAQVMQISGLIIPIIWIVTSTRLHKILHSFRISYVIGIIGVVMFFLMYVFGIFDVSYNTNFMSNENISSRILWSMHNNAVFVVIFAGIVFLLERRSRSK